MTTTIRAVYQDGLLRPDEPLDLPDGTAVRLTLTTPTGNPPVEVPDPPPTPAEEEIIRRIQEAKTLQEWIDITNAAPDPDDGYDLPKALNENRRLSGEEPLFPPEYLETDR